MEAMGSELADIGQKQTDEIFMVVLLGSLAEDMVHSQRLGIQFTPN